MARLSRLINRKVVTLLALALAMFLIATNVQAALLYLVSSALLAVVVISYAVASWSVYGLSAARHAPAEAFEHVPLTLEAVVHNGGRWARALLSIHDDLAPDIEPALAWLPGRRAVSKRYETTLPRGVFAEAPLVVSCAAPFGIWTARRAFSAAAGLTVFPLFEDIPTLPILEAMSSPAETLHERRGAGAGYDYLGIRDYRRGDSLRVVHWRSSARRGELVVKEFEEEIASPVTVVVVGAGVAGEPGNTTLDAAARLAATIANYCLTSGHPLRLIGWDETAGLLSLDRPNLAQSLEWLAALQPAITGTPERLAEEAAVLVSARSTVIMVTADVSADWAGVAAAVEARRVRLLTVLIDRATYAGGKESSLDKGQAAAELAQSRATVYVYGKDESITACLSEPWRVTAR